MNDWRSVVNAVIAIATLVSTTGLIIVVWQNRFDPVLTNLVVKNFAAIIGLPFAFMASFVVIALFRQGSEPIVFEGFGLKFQGASGEIVLWMLCFIVISSMIHLLWQK